MRSKSAYGLLLSCMLYVCGGTAFAQQADPRSSWRVGFGFGFGERSNPLAAGDDIPILVDVDIAWFGKRFFFDNGDVGFTIADNSHGTINAVVRFASDRVFFSKTDTRFIRVGDTAQSPVEVVQVEPPDRDYAVETGIELLLDGDWGELQIAGYHDIGDTHGGYEVFFDYGYGRRYGRFYVEPSVGMSLKSAARNDYYWGVSASEATVGLPMYEAGSGVNVHARLRASYHINKHVAVALSVSYERLNHEMTASPLVVDDDVVGYFGGVFYRF